MLYELHKIDKTNVGDYYCNPSRYFAFDSVVTETITSKKFNAYNKNIIVGGGGLIHKTFDPYIQRLLDQEPKFSAAWSIGHNYGPAVRTKGRPFLFPEYLNGFDLLGVRDWIPGHEDVYLPCVTCMHPAFDQTYHTQHDIVFYLHDSKTSDQSFTNSLPTKNNSDGTIDSVVEFLASGETVVTNSYHGAYWALLLGRRVITASWSIKFDYFKYPPTIVDQLVNWAESTGSAADSGYLEESRELNRLFYKKVLNAI